MGSSNRRQSWVRRWVVADHNVFYPASAVCMMVGCLLLSSSMGLGWWKPASATELLALIAAMQLYELLLIATAVWIIRRGGLWRDGRLLLIAETFFLVDAAQLKPELLAVDPYTGSIVSAVVLTLVPIKLIAVVRGLRLDVAWSHVVMLCGALAVMIGLPTALKVWCAPGAVGPWHMYGGWWLVAIVMAVHGAWPHRPARPSRWLPIGRVVNLWLVGAVYVALIVHLAGTGWVYDVPFRAEFAAPVLVGLSVALPRVMPAAWRASAGQLVEYGLPLAALYLTLHPASWLICASPLAPDVLVSPLRLTLIGAAAAFVVHAVRRPAIATVGAALLCAIAAAMGHSIAEIVATARQLVPRSRQTYSALAVVAAFALLGVGAAVSAAQHRRRNDPDRTGRAPSCADLDATSSAP